MPLPPAPTQRASLLSAQAIANAEKAAIAPAPSQRESVAKKTNNKKSAPQALDALEVIKPAAKQVAAPASAPAPKKAKSAKKNNGPTKLFVLDTNVLMHDPMCLFQFEEHDVYLPMIVLEELDSHKKGMTEVARNARQTSRSLDALAAAPDSDMKQGLPLSTTGHIEAGGKLFFQTQIMDVSLPMSLPQGKADNQILGVVQALGKLHAP
ncbi:MAG: PhoH-like protein, partial [Pseudomonadota bacterium]